jgi:hypothetical protein
LNQANDTLLQDAGGWQKNVSQALSSPSAGQTSRLRLKRENDVERLRHSAITLCSVTSRHLFHMTTQAVILCFAGVILGWALLVVALCGPQTF